MQNRTPGKTGHLGSFLVSEILDQKVTVQLQNSLSHWKEGIEIFKYDLIQSDIGELWRPQAEVSKMVFQQSARDFCDQLQKRTQEK